MAVNSGGTLLHVGGNGITVWNVDILPAYGAVGSLSVASTMPIYYYCGTNADQDAHWASSRGMYVSAGEEVQIIDNGSFSGDAQVQMLYDQL